MPISGLRGGNVLQRESTPGASWYEGPTLLELLDSVDLPLRSDRSALRIPIIDRTKDQGLVIYGKIESGRVVKGLKVSILPTNAPAEVLEILGADERELLFANSGENIRLKLKIPDEFEVQRGFVVCDIHDTCHADNEFKAIVEFLDLLENKPIVTQGYQCILHIHTAVEECQVVEVISVVDLVRRKKVASQFARANQTVILRLQVNNSICVENFADVPQLGRFTLRDEGRTIGLGKVIEQVSKNAEDIIEDLRF